MTGKYMDSNMMQIAQSMKDDLQSSNVFCRPKGLV